MNHNLPGNKNRKPDDAEDAFTSEGGYVAREFGSEHRSDAALMSQLSIRYDGRRYRYGHYRYDRFADAVAYAHLMRLRRTPDESVASVAEDKLEMPSAADRQRMAALSISFKDGVYEFNGFHYDHLDDAVDYALLTHRRQVAGLWPIA